MSGPVAILLLEDDPNLGRIVKESLEREGFAVTLCADGEAGLEAFAGEACDLCLVDVMMPRVDGFAFARELRRRDRTVPLIFLTARSLTEDRIEGFRLGGDDYVTKPFSMEELVLRIRAVLRRAGTGGAAGGPDGDVHALGEYEFDARQQVLRRAGEERRLTDRESELLALLCRHRDEVLDRGLALRRIWGDDSYHNSRSMDVFVSRLRKYLADDPRISIRAVHGRGFRLRIE
jgi:DNA-binding response OmpR family regulator